MRMQETQANAWDAASRTQSQRLRRFSANEQDTQSHSEAVVVTCWSNPSSRLHGQGLAQAGGPPLPSRARAAGRSGVPREDLVSECVRPPHIGACPLPLLQTGTSFVFAGDGTHPAHAKDMHGAFWGQLFQREVARQQRLRPHRPLVLYTWTEEISSDWRRACPR